MRSSFHWNSTQHRLVVSYRRFGTTYRSPLQESNSRVTSQKTEELILTAAEA